MSERNTYIENNDFAEALDSFLQKIDPMTIEAIPTADAVGRVLSAAVVAKVCDPSYNAAAMDGICVVSDNVSSASLDAPLTLKLNTDFLYVNTGNAIEGKFDSVIMIEDVLIIDHETVQITSPSTLWQHVRVIGESVVASEMILPAYAEIRPMDLGALLGSGNMTVEVFKKPRVGIIPTGNEMVQSIDDLRVGKLIESNSAMFAALLTQYGAIPHCYGVTPDDKNLLREAIRLGVNENDILIINAGSSAGTKDYVSGILKELGTIATHGLAIRPGKPTILAFVDGKPVIGVPGYPVSAYTVLEKVVKPIVYKTCGKRTSTSQTVEATLTKRITSTFKSEEFIRVALGRVDGKLVATPLDRGAAAVMSLVKADAILNVPRYVEGLECGEKVGVQLLKSPDSIEKSLVVIGSNDMIIDYIADKMPLSSSHVGSLAGLLALKNNATHLAPTHLLDKDGTYNVKAALELFSGGETALIKGVSRIQGILVKKGNPLNILSIKDIPGHSFANRQRGAGTRVLFDYLLEKNGIKSDRIFSYDKEYGTHLSVAAAVLNGVADCGIAVQSAANTLGLDFIPIGAEEYDFLVRTDMLTDERIQRFISIIKSTEFRKKVSALGGYEFLRTGEVDVVK